MFERFYRFRQPLGDGVSGGGSGLGLAIVAAIVAGHGGRVGVAPTPGGGATFVVSLPLTHVADTTPEEPRRPASIDDHGFTADSQR